MKLYIIALRCAVILVVVAKQRGLTSMDEIMAAPVPEGAAPRLDDLAKSLVDLKGILKPTKFAGTEGTWNEWR